MGTLLTMPQMCPGKETWNSGRRLIRDLINFIFMLIIGQHTNQRQPRRTFWTRINVIISAGFSHLSFAGFQMENQKLPKCGIYSVFFRVYSYMRLNSFRPKPTRTYLLLFSLPVFIISHFNLIYDVVGLCFSFASLCPHLWAGTVVQTFLSRPSEEEAGWVGGEG